MKSGQVGRNRLETKPFAQYGKSFQVLARSHTFIPEALLQPVEPSGLQATAWGSDTVASVTASSVRDLAASPSTRIAALG